MTHERELSDALYTMSHLLKHSKEGVEVAVFRDNGWGDDREMGESSYIIIVDGNGQVPLGAMSKECFELLIEDGYLEHNTLKTYKDRGYYKYLGPDNIGFYGWNYVSLKEIKP